MPTHPEKKRKRTERQKKERQKKNRTNKSFRGTDITNALNA
jgi:hypothetical protein